MKASLPRPASPSVFSNASTKNILTVAVSIGVLVYLWTLNYNRLGSFYDYSIMADAAGKFGAGLRPFRDFNSTLQTLSFWAARACELLFGPRYLALAYGNLLLTLGLFFVVVHYARMGFSLAVAVLVGMAVTVASTLQHGIIWYNSIALLLLSAISLKCAELLRSRLIRSRDAILVSVLLLLIGMTKMNFNAVAIGVVAFVAVVGAVNMTRFQTGKKTVALAVLAVVACGAPPLVEAFANHVALSTWVREVIVTPASRAGALAQMANSDFYILEWNAYYPGTVLKGAVLFCLTVYGFLIHLAIKQLGGDQRRDFKGLIIRLGMIGLFWASTCLLVLTNVEIESFCLCFCLIGVVGMQISGQFPGEKWEKALQNSAILLTTYFLLVGGVSLARHSRISYKRNVFAGDTRVSDGNPTYLRGVELSRQAALRLASVDDLMKKNTGVPVYWGPGLEIMNRIYGGVVDPVFPLWYHLNVTVRDSDANALIAAIERSDAKLVVADKEWRPELPTEVQQYLDRVWTREGQDSPLLVYRRRPAGQNNAGSAGR